MSTGPEDTGNSIPWHRQHIPAHGHAGKENSALPDTPTLPGKQWNLLNYSSAEGGNTCYPQFWGKTENFCFSACIFRIFFLPFLSSWEPPGTSQALSLSGSRGGKGRQGIPRLSASPGCPNSKEIINRAEGGAQGGYGLSHPIPAGKTLLQRDQAGQGSRSLPFPALGAVGGKGRIPDYYSHHSHIQPFSRRFWHFSLSHTFIFTHSCRALLPSCEGFIHKPLEWEGEKQEQQQGSPAMEFFLLETPGMFSCPQAFPEEPYQVGRFIFQAGVAQLTRLKQKPGSIRGLVLFFQIPE